MVGHDCDSNGGMRVPIEAIAGDKSGFLLDGSGNFGEGSSAEGIRIYTRKRRKMSNSDGMVKTKFSDKIKAADGNASDQDVARLSFEAFPFGPRECSLRHCRKVVLQQMYQSLSGSENGLRECIRNALLTHPESGCTSAIKESFDCFERSVVSNGSINESESSTSTELCRRAFFDILMSEKFSELCGLLLKNFGDVNVNRILDVNAINSRMKNGAYETSPLLYLNDIQQVWTKLQHVGTEMVTLANTLSDKSRTQYEQFIRKPMPTQPPSGTSNCKKCAENTNTENCLVCDSCEETYHVACTDLIPTQLPPKSWYCPSCVSNGMGSPHTNCIVCDKLKSVNRVTINDESQDVPNGHGGELTDRNEGSNICFICKSQVKPIDVFRTCGHSLCAHKFYHYTCLTSKQLGVCGPCWYCPSCLCRGCLVDKDDEQIVLCDGCDEAYHIYCASPPLDSVPEGTWFCMKCERELKRITTVKRVYENKMKNKVKIENAENENESGALDMLVSAAKRMEYGYP